MVENLATTVKEVMDKAKEMKECMPSFWDKMKHEPGKVNIYEPVYSPKDGKLTEFQKEVLANNHGFSEEGIKKITLWEDFETGQKFGENIDESSETGNDTDNGDDVEDSQNEAREDNQYFSSYEERLQQTPKENSDRGQWEGERGESKFIPYDEEIKDILSQYGLDGIDYKDGIPDFSGVSESTVEIDNMTDNRAENFKQCDAKAAEQWNKEGRDGRTDWTARDVAQWRKENGYSWHERNDMKTCDLVLTKVNDYFGHLGGVSECKKRDASDSNGGDFDE